jgi:hypothetical protein
VASIWIGLAIAYAASRVPPSFAILTVSTGAYVVTLAVTAVTRHRHAPRLP